MAGYALGFDDGGDVGESWNPETDQDNVAPGVPADTQPMPASVTAPQMPQDQRTPANTMMAAPDGAFSQNQADDPRVKMYLGATDAADPATMKGLMEDAKNTHGAGDSDAALLAVHKAFELGGPEAAWQAVQFNRGAYNAKQSFAAAALTGNESKPANPQAAALAATQAQQHVLDGADTQFHSNPDGSFTATTQMPGTTQKQSFQLSNDAMKDFLNVGGTGLYDNLLDSGTPAVLQKLQGMGIQGGDATPGTSKQSDTMQDDPTGTGGGTDISDPQIAKNNYGGELESRADRKFGYGQVYNPDRVTYMDEQEEKDLNRQNALDKASAEGKNKRDVAELQGGVKRDVQGMKGEQFEKLNQSKEKIAGENNETKKGIADEANQTRRDNNQANNQSREGIAKGNNQSREQIEQNRIAAAQRAQSDKALQVLQAEQRKNLSSEQQRNLTAARAEITSNPTADASKVLQKWGFTPPAAQPTGQGSAEVKPTPAATTPAATTPSVTAPSQSNATPARPPAGTDAKFYKGNWYTRGPNGESVLYQPQ